MPDEKAKPNPVFDRLRGDAPAGEGRAEYLNMRDGSRIFLESWEPPGITPKRIVVCFHGAGGQGQFFALFADRLAPRGAAVFVADYRGHGLSGGPMGDFASFQTLLDDCHEVVEHARMRFPGLPVFILGESMGGAMAVNYTAQHPDIVHALILFSPALRFTKSAIPFAELLKLPYYLLVALLAPEKAVIPITGQENRGIKNPIHVEFDRTDPQHLKFISPRYFLQLNKCMGIAFNDCPQKIHAPTILFQGGQDPAISPGGARQFIANLAANDKELVFYPKGFHSLITDPDAAGAGDKLVAWVEKH